MSYDMSRLEGYGYDKKEENKPSKIISIISDQKNEKKKTNNYQKYGTDRAMIEKGIAYRLGLIENVEITTEGQQFSFDYGMYDNASANLQLDTMIKHSYIPGRLKNILVEKMLGNNKRLTREQAQQLLEDKTYVQNIINNILLETGKRDSNDKRIIIDELPESVQNNEYYLMGYNSNKRKGGR